MYKTEEEIELMKKRLHNQANILNNKKGILRDNYYNQICTFSPHIIKRNTNNNNNNNYNINEIPSMKNFFNRLQNWVDKRNYKYEIDIEKI
jgi:hypothetical protein